MTIPLAYFLRIPNVGDRVAPQLAEAISGEPTVWTRHLDRMHLLSVGSVMAQATPSSIVWGSGVMHPDLGVGAARPENIKALRGPGSVIALRGAGIPVGDVPLGDPGFLAPELLGVTRAEQPTHRLGVVAHYVDRQRPAVAALLRAGGVVDLNVHDEPGAFLEAMSRCGAVVSSSLHGLVFAESLGIPSLWIKCGDDIAGGEFKFADWFATMTYPQKFAMRLKETDTADTLLRSTMMHESKIDRVGLKAAFPSNVPELDAPTYSLAVARQRPIPVFLISFNRAEMLRRAIAGVRMQDRPTQIVIHDNGSTDGETLSLLASLEASGVRVYRREPIADADELSKVDETVSGFFADWAEPSRYVVSDCDIDLSVAAPNTIAVYDHLLNTHRQVESVGPMLRIRDIPRGYPLYNRAMNRHIDQFWRYAPSIIETPFGQVAVQECSIDTTFALHRAGEPFRRLKKSLRVYEPYEALHLDWHRTVADDDDYTATSDASISHWNNAIERERHQAAVLEFSEFTAIRVRGDGTLETYVIQIS